MTTMHPDDFEADLLKVEKAAAELVKLFARLKDEDCMEETAGYADEIVHNLKFLRPQIDEMLARREEDMRRGRIAYDREMAAAAGVR